MNKSYITLSKTNIFNAVISINSKNEQKYYHKYKPEIGVNITANSIELHSIGSLTGKWKQEPFKIINYSIFLSTSNLIFSMLLTISFSLSSTGSKRISKSISLLPFKEIHLLGKGSISSIL